MNPDNNLGGWTMVGRTLHHDATPTLVFHRVVLSPLTGAYAVDPTAADALAQKIADLLTRNGQTVEQIVAAYLAQEGKTP